jgi:hypothetical protein
MRKNAGPPTKYLSWRDGDQERIERHVRVGIEALNPNGTASGSNIWRLDVACRILARYIEIPVAPRVYDRVALFRRTFLGASPAVLASAPMERFLERLTGFVEALAREPEKPYVVLLPLNVDRRTASACRSIRVGGEIIRASTWPRLSKRLELSQFWDRASRVVDASRGAWIIKTNFAPFTVSVLARTAHDAWAKAHPRFELLRAALNVQALWGRSIEQWGMRSEPIAELWPCPLYAVFDERGTEAIWLRTSPIHQYRLRALEIDFDQARQLIQRIERTPGQDLRELLTDALLKYGQAIDTVEWRESFMLLWQALESLALTVRENRKWDVAQRVVRLLGSSPLERDLLTVLQDTRNDLVHAGAYPDDYGQHEANLMRHALEWCLERLVDLAPSLRSCAGLELFYSIEDLSDTALAERKRLVSVVQARRRKARRTAKVSDTEPGR